MRWKLSACLSCAFTMGRSLLSFGLIVRKAAILRLTGPMTCYYKDCAGRVSSTVLRHGIVIWQSRLSQTLLRDHNSMRQGFYPQRSKSLYEFRDRQRGHGVHMTVLSWSRVGLCCSRCTNAAIRGIPSSPMAGILRIRKVGFWTVLWIYAKGSSLKDFRLLWFYVLLVGHLWAVFLFFFSLRVCKSLGYIYLLPNRGCEPGCRYISQLSWRCDGRVRQI